MSRGEELLKMASASLFRSQANAMGSRAANQAFRKMADRRMTDTIVSLCKAYKDWQSEGFKPRENASTHRVTYLLFPTPNNVS